MKNKDLLFKGNDEKTNRTIFGYYFDYLPPNSKVKTPCIMQEYGQINSIKPETLGQFIGLYDKDHTPIFSNSKVAILVDNKQQSIEKVVYVVEKASFMLEATLGNGKKIYHPLPLPNKDLVIKEIKVIGE